MDGKDGKAMLSNTGLKNTRPRSLILQCLEGSEIPLSAQDIYMKLQQSSNPVCFSTVYRVLDKLTEKGVLNKTFMPDGGKAYFEISRHRHSHKLVCLKCRKAVDIGECPISMYNDIIQKTGFVITGHSFEIYGVCKSCSK